jgi:hypothetical protein
MTKAPPCRFTNASVVPLPATTVALGPLLAGKALANEVNDQWKINLRAAGAFLCQEPPGADGADNACRGSAPIQPVLICHTTEQGQVSAKLGFAAGNDLHPALPFVLAPWAADLQDGVNNINGRDRSYLLEAWYAHTFKLGSDNSMQIPGAIIDTAFYANDQYTQSINEVFDSSRNAFLPAYDWGGVLAWQYRD